MNRPTPPELFAERPVISDFAHYQRKPGLSRRLIVTLCLVILVLCALMGFGTFAAYKGFLTPSSASLASIIPTIKAAIPLKQKPEQPGGIDIPHQDVTVFQQVEKNDASQKPPVEHLLPPSETPTPSSQSVNRVPAPIPTTVTSESMETLIAPGAVTNTRAVTLSLESSPALAPPPAHPPVSVGFETKDIGAADAVVKGNTPPLSPPPPPPTQAQAQADVVPPPSPPPLLAPVPTPPPPVSSFNPFTGTPSAAPETRAVDVPPPAPSPIPSPPIPSASIPAPPVPATVSAPPVVAETKVEKAMPVKTEIRDESASSGNFKIQLASIPDQAMAERTVNDLQRRYAEVLGGVPLRLVEADIPGKGIYYRIQGGGLSESAAKALCAALTKQKAACLVVKP